MKSAKIRRPDLSDDRSAGGSMIIIFESITNIHTSYLEETNSVDNVLIPYLERYITDNHTLSLDDVNIIAQHDLEINQKTI